MKPETIDQARNPLLAKALPALQRAGRQARLLAAQTGTDLIVLENGKIRRINISAEEVRVTREQHVNCNAKNTDQRRSADSTVISRS